MLLRRSAPSPIRSFAAMTALLELFLTAPAADAGTWQRNIGSPAYTLTITATGNLTGVANTLMPGSANINPILTGQNEPGRTAKNTGTATMTYTWVPTAGEPPPATVYVQDTIQESVTISGNGSVTGTATPATPVTITSYRAVQVTGTTLVLTSSQMSTSYNATSSSGNFSIMLSLNYSTLIYSPSITLTGTTPDANGNPNILVGQGCTAKLSGIPGGTGWTTAYNWSVSGTKFQSWNVAYVAGISSTATVTTGLGAVNNSTAHWYWNDPIVNPQTANETVTCTATVTPPAGQGNAFNITATKTVIVQAPAWQAIGRGGYMQVNALANGDSNPELWAGPTPAMKTLNEPVGMFWQAIVTTPTVPAFGTGSLQLIQIVTPSDSYTTLTTPVQSYSDPLNGVKGLDLTYPYGNHIYLEAPAPASYIDDDNPGMHLLSGGVAGNIVMASATFQSTYIDYLMYQPSAATADPNYPAVQWIALGQFSWSTNGNATIPNTKKWTDYVTQNGSDAANTIPLNGQTVTPNVQTQFGGVMGPAFYPTWTTLDVSKHYPTQ